MTLGPLIEFLDHFPSLVSAGHDGFWPYERRPFDEIYVIAQKGEIDEADDHVEIILPYGNYIEISNIPGLRQSIRVHRAGYMWHDRIRDIPKVTDEKYLSIWGPTKDIPNHKETSSGSLFVALPGNPSQDNLFDLLPSQTWQDIKDTHTQKREWLPLFRKIELAQKSSTKDIADCIERIDKLNKESPPKSIQKLAHSYERNAPLVKIIKKFRGNACQICGYSFTKQDGEDYSELHHLEHLANNGLDISSNLLVLCANHHKQFHFGKVKILTHTKEILIAEIDGIKHECSLTFSNGDDSQ